MMALVNFLLLVMAVVSLIVALGAAYAGVYDVAVLEVFVAGGLVLLSKV